MATVVTQNNVALYLQPDGKGTALDLASVDRHGAGDKTIPRAGRDLVSGRDVYGNPRIKDTVKTPPGGLITLNVEWEKITTPEFLETTARCGEEFGLWEFFMECGRLDNLSGWGRLDFYGGLGVTQNVQGAAPTIAGEGNRVVNNVDISGVHHVIWTPLEISAQTILEPEDLLDIAGLDDCYDDCWQGYAGPDQILYTVSAANAGSPGDSGSVWYTVNGGGAWAQVPLPDPFETDEDISHVVMMLISKTQYRVVVGRGTADAGNPPEVAYGDFTFGAPATTTWNQVEVGTTNNQYIEGLEWLFYDRMYTAAGGDIYISTDQAESWGSAIYTGATVINAFAKDKDDNVWAVGESNLILRELAKSGTFDTRVGPSGGGTFYSVAVANDGRLYAGNGSSVYLSTNAAANTGGWTELRDFGTNHSVVEINIAGQAEVDNGEGQLLTVIVDDSTPGNGEVWRSWDGGNSWRQTTELTNQGYNAAYFSRQDDNLAIICGDTSGSYGVIHKYSPCTTC